MLPNILCDKCQSKRATVTLTRIKNGKVVEMHLCQQCASDVSPFQKKLAEAQNDIGQILASLLGQKKAVIQKVQEAHLEEQKVPSLNCKVCGLPFSTYRKTMFLGCPGCYDSFEEHLIVDLRRIHGATRHIKITSDKRDEDVAEKDSGVRQYTLEELNNLLRVAIEEERFEDAARLRDEIKSIKSGF